MSQAHYKAPLACAVDARTNIPSRRMKMIVLGDSLLGIGPTHAGISVFVPSPSNLWVLFIDNMSNVLYVLLDLVHEIETGSACTYRDDSKLPGLP